MLKSADTKDASIPGGSASEGVGRDVRTVLVTGSDGQLGRSLYDIVRHGSDCPSPSGTAFQTVACPAADSNRTDESPAAGGNQTVGCPAADINALTVCGARWVFTARKQSDGIEIDDLLDITSNEQVNAAIDKWGADIIINCAAYTDVEKAETCMEDAEEVNAGAVYGLASAAASRGASLIHFSTDYVFDGDKKSGPYTENDQPHPINAYGMSKYRGELFARKSGADVTVIRTSALFSEYGKNFVRTMCRLISEKESVSVVDDQTVSPTYARDLAEFVLCLVESRMVAAGQRTLGVHTSEPVYEPASASDSASELSSASDSVCESASEPVYSSAPADSPSAADSFRILNFSNEGSCTWFGFAEEIARLMGSPSCKVIPCTSVEYPSRVCRPRYSVLDKTVAKAFLDKPVANSFLDKSGANSFLEKSAAKAFIDVIPSWRDALARCLGNLGVLEMM